MATDPRQKFIQRMIAEECVAFADPAEAFDAHGRILPLDKIPERLRKAIASYETEERKEERDGRQVTVVVTRITFHDKVETLRKLLEMRGGP